MTFAYDKAFDLIASRVEEELAKTGFTREKVSSSDPNELVALYTSENVAYSVLYTKDKQQMILRTCAMTADEGPDNDWKTLATWLYDDADATQKDAESIANDFIDGVSGSVAIKRTKQTKSKKKKSDDGNADPKFLAKRFIAVLPELREEIMDEEDYYYPFRGATFAKEHIAPKLPSYISGATFAKEHIAPKLPSYISRATNKDLEKLVNILNTQYGNGDTDTRAVITTVLLNSLNDSDYEKLRDYFNDELTIAAKFARKYKGKTVKPEVVKVKKPSRFSTLRDQ